MPTLITAGDATTGLTQTGGNDGALTIQTGPAGSKVSAIALSSAGGATFSQITGGALTLSTTQNTTSGTSVEFTGIPSWVKRITIMFNGVSTNGTAPVIVQLGTGVTPTYTTSGYISYVLFNAGTTSSTFGITTVGVGSGDTRWGSMILSTSGSNNWSAVVGNAVGTNGGAGGGGIALAGALTAIRLIGSTTGSPVDTFDAGSVNIMYEG